MIFTALSEAADAGELLILEGGLCRFHVRRDGQLTIHEILVLPQWRRRGIGRTLLRMLCARPGIRSIVARCPEGLVANAWYAHMGFEERAPEVLRSGRRVRVWERVLL